jgi:hypothetical protein
MTGWLINSHLQKERILVTAPPGLAPESALRLHPCSALPSAPVRTSVEEELVLGKDVIVVDREK